MKEKDYFEGILNSTKLASDLLMHASIEASNDKINNVFIKSEQTILEIQHELFNIMKEKQWYKLENIKESEIKKALKKQKKA